MPVIASSFHPPWFLRNGHLQTILPVLFPRSLPIVFRDERLELEDGDFLDLHWAPAQQEAAARSLVILSHGLEGSAGNGYIRGMASAFNAAGWDALAWDFRGCGSEPNRLVRFYHSGETRDLAAVIRHAAAEYPRIALVGFSLGGNITLKYMGEAPPHPAIIGAAGISVPVDLAACAQALDLRRSNHIYLGRFLKTLIAKVEAKAARFPAQLDTTGIRNIRSFREFDDRYTARIHGFRDAADYWAQSSARQHLPGITLPTLLLSARNDPFLTPESFPFAEAERHPYLFFEAPASGGHVGFLDFVRGMEPWSERRVVEFVTALV
jgi:hypothetical protein